jgi:chromosome segregation ATPase
MGLTVSVAVACAAVGFVVAWLLSGKTRRSLVVAGQELESLNASLSSIEAELAELREKHADSLTELQGCKEEDQKRRIQVTELERRIHDSNMWEVKYEKLLKQHQECSAKISELEKTKVELNFCQQQLAAARKKTEELSDGGA